MTTRQPDPGNAPVDAAPGKVKTDLNFETVEEPICSVINKCRGRDI